MNVWSAPVPILARETYEGAQFSYSDFLGRYVLVPGMPRDGRRKWAPGEGGLVYLIAPDGGVEQIRIPPEHWRPQEVFPARSGLVWVSNATRHGSADAGGWLLKEDGTVTKLFSQLVDGAGVSPDGRMLVFAVNDFNPKTTEYVQAMML